MASSSDARQSSILRQAGRVVFFVAILFVLYSASYFTSRCLGINLFREPVLAVHPGKAELGDVESGRLIPVTIRVTNQGGGELSISSVKGSCDACITVKSFPKQAIRSGQSAEIELDVSTGGTAGALEKRVLISSNDWTGRPYLLKVSWNVVSPDGIHAETNDESAG